jgi:hypothetical protein
VTVRAVEYARWWLAGLVLGLALGGLVNTPRRWLRLHPRAGFETTPWEPGADTTSSNDPVEREVQRFKQYVPEATKADLDELRRVLRARAKT